MQNSYIYVSVTVVINSATTTNAEWIMDLIKPQFGNN